MRTKHTPGPWRVGMSNVLVWTGKAWAKMSGHHGGAAIGKEEARANMLLAAAAPDLLEALCIAEAFVTKFEDDDDYTDGQCETAAAIRSAIAKATGENNANT